MGSSTIVSMWFSNEELSLALGISLAFPMFGSSINGFLTPIVNKLLKSNNFKIILNIYINIKNHKKCIKILKIKFKI